MYAAGQGWRLQPRALGPAPRLPHPWDSITLQSLADTDSLVCALRLSEELMLRVKEAEGMFLRLEEFCSLANVMRRDTSHVLEENIPFPKAEMMQMCGISAKVGPTEGLHQAGWGPSLPPGSPHASGQGGPQCLLAGSAEVTGSTGLPSFRNRVSCSHPKKALTSWYRTEDSFPVSAGKGMLQTPAATSLHVL